LVAIAKVPPHSAHYGFNSTDYKDTANQLPSLAPGPVSLAPFPHSSVLLPALFILCAATFAPAVGSVLSLLLPCLPLALSCHSTSPPSAGYSHLIKYILAQDRVLSLFFCEKRRKSTKSSLVKTQKGDCIKIRNF
jgi:hypothetical protein